jgi:hypothetical protein
MLHALLLEDGVEDSQILYLSFEGMKYDHLKNQKALYYYIFKKAPKK